jgi:hypothetical protein
MSTCRDASKENWTSNGSIEHINAGSLQRIADAMEKVALNYDRIITEKRWAEEARDRYMKRLETERHRTAALRGVIRRMKKGTK